MSWSRLFIFSVAAAGFFATPALGHHLTGGAMPQSFAQGLLSGLGHPIIGLDHLAALIGIGLLAALLPDSLKLIFLFSADMIGGVGLHLAKVTLPAAELYVALATVAIGAVIVARTVNPWLSVGLVTATGVIHGYALGESIVGAEPSPLAAYFLGLFVIQALVGLAAFGTARALLARKRQKAFPICGGIIAAIGVAFAIGI